MPAPASAAATEEVSETVTEAEDRSGPALATEPRKMRGKGPKKAAEEGESCSKEERAEGSCCGGSQQGGGGDREETRCQERKESYGLCGGEERRRSARTGCA